MAEPRPADPSPEPRLSWDEADDLVDDTLRFVSEMEALMRAERLAEEARQDDERRLLEFLDEAFAEADRELAVERDGRGRGD